MHGFPECAVDPGGNFAALVEGGLVAEFSLLRFRAGFRNRSAIGQPPGQHLIGDDPEREDVRSIRAAFTEEVFGRRVLHGAQNGIFHTQGRVVGDAGNPRRAEIDDLHGAGLVDHDVVGPEILMQHLHPVEGLQALGDLFDDAAHGLEVRPRIVDHPLLQRLPVDEFRRDVQIAALSRLEARLQDVRAVDAARDPFLHPESLQVGLVRLAGRWKAS